MQLISRNLAIAAVALTAFGCGPSAESPREGSPAADGASSAGSAAEASYPIVKTGDGREMVQLPGGMFTMGSGDGKEDEQPPREVQVSPFLIDRTEVTQAQYEALMNTNVSRFKGANLPAEQVAWAGAVLFCNARSRAEGLEPCYDEETGECNFEANGYRLPTEAEWEYAARAGSDGPYFFGADPRLLSDYAWHEGNANGKTHQVGQLRPNPFGLCDMLGNVGEWCNDYYDPAAYDQGGDQNAQDPRGPAETEKFVLRGGSYHSKPEALRVSARTGEYPGQIDGCLGGDHLGFRTVRNAPQTP